MVFYIIAAAEKDIPNPQNPGQINYKPEQTVEAKIKSIRAFTEGRVGQTELHRINVS
jgi:hypothetical protein